MWQKGATSSGVGVSILEALGVVFITLKALGVAPVAGWSWWWVTLPIWIAPAVIIMFVACLAIIVSVFTRDDEDAEED